jgi:hypothetical protein
LALGEGLTNISLKTSHVSKPEDNAYQGPELSCGGVQQKEVPVIGTDPFNIIIFVLVTTFSDFNAILHGSAITHARNRVMFGLKADYS